MAYDNAHSLKKGFISVVILVIMTIIVIYLSVIFKTTSYVTDFIGEQEQFLRFENNYHALQQYCIALIKNNFDSLVQNLERDNKPIQFAFAWPPENQKQYAARVLIKQAGQGVAFDLTYQSQQNRILHATVEKKYDTFGKPFYVIAQWRQAN